MRTIAGMRLRELLRRTYHELNDDDLLSYAAALAYHAILALFPFLLFLLAVFTFLQVPELFNGVLGWAANLFPASAMRQIRHVVLGFEQSHDTGLLSVGILGAIWAASGGIRSAMTALNRIYDVQETRPAWKRYLLSLAYTLALAVLILVAMALLMLGPGLVGRVAEHLHLGRLFVAIWSWARYPLAVALLVLVAALVYSLLPDVPGFRLLTTGSVVAIVLWIAGSYGFQLYTRNLGHYNVLYGAVGAFVVLLLYMWTSAIALLLGGELDAVLDDARRSDHPRTPPT